MFFALLFSALCSFLLLWALLPGLCLGLLDEPNERSSHSQPTPRGGGLAFVIVSAVSSGIVLISGHATAAASLPLLAFPLAIVGLLDDRLDLPATGRYGVQLLTGSLMLCVSHLVQKVGFEVAYGSWLMLIVLVLLVIAVTAVINFTNFMDGLDGLVAGCLAVSIAALSVVLDAAWPLWALVGSLLGFLFWNWSPAKVFMGDVGSTFLGAVFAGLVLQASSWTEAFCYFLVATPLLGDACFCVLRRLFAGQRVFQAHRLHLFQRLYQAGWSHARVSLIYISATALLTFAMFAGGLPWVLSTSVAEILLGVWLDQRVAVPFAVASKS